MRKHLGFTLLEILLGSSLLTLFLSAAYAAAQHQRQSAEVGQTVAVVRSYIAFGESIAQQFPGGLDAYQVVANLPLGLLPQELIDEGDVVRIRNPLGEGTIAYTASRAADGGSQWTIRVQDAPAWACVQLIGGLHDAGVVSAAGAGHPRVVNRDATGQHMVPDPAVVNNACAGSNTVTVSVSGPAV